MFSKKRAKSTLESLMYIWGEPLDIKDAAEAAEISKEEALECFLELRDEYDQEGRGLMIRQIKNSFQFVTRPENADAIEKLCRPVKTRKLTQAALETLAIVAYKQPVTKSEIDAIRGIKSDRIIEGLMKKDLVCEKGRSDGIGRPILYGTTDNFLKQFGLTNIKELPEFEEHEDFVIDKNDDMPYMQMKIDV
ncbi:MAG: SMC-Scp complex subunit ScpB [Eubacterium sp.]|nr:SMC-Scp complex subunit ScpB [Eubacterium sp.]